jgi:hypothetical protein
MLTAILAVRFSGSPLSVAIFFDTQTKEYRAHIGTPARILQSSPPSKTRAGINGFYFAYRNLAKEIATMRLHINSDEITEDESD